MKKVISALVVFSLLLSTSMSVSAEIEIHGAPSCSNWVLNEQQLWPSLVNNQWLNGYLSGFAITYEKDFLRQTDFQATQLWMNNYCQANPLSNVQVGANILVLELIKRMRQ